MDEFDEVENDEAGEQGSGDGPKALRNLVKQLQKQMRDQEEELKGYRKAARSTKVADLLPKGFPKAAAKFYDAEDVSQEAVDAWAKANAEAFNYTPEQADDGQQQVNREAAAAQAAMHQATAPFGAVGAEAVAAGDPSVGSVQEMLALLQDPNVSTDDLVARGLLKLDQSTI